MKLMLASMAVVLTFCAAPAVSAEFPKTGEAEYDTYYVDTTVAKIDSGAGAGAIVDVTGITRNVKGEGPFCSLPRTPELGGSDISLQR